MKIMMRYQKILFIFLSLFFYTSISFAETYCVTALNEVPNISSHFWVHKIYLTTEHDTPYVIVEFMGNCAENDTCEFQVGRYPLPSDKVIYDGERRWKYIGEGNYLTIARSDRTWASPFQGEWHLRNYVELNVTPNGYQSITLNIHTPRAP